MNICTSEVFPWVPEVPRPRPVVVTAKSKEPLAPRVSEVGVGFSMIVLGFDLCTMWLLLFFFIRTENDVS